jgi:hypothetical protein
VLKKIESKASAKIHHLYAQFVRCHDGIFEQVHGSWQLLN